MRSHHERIDWFRRGIDYYSVSIFEDLVDQKGFVNYFA